MLKQTKNFLTTTVYQNYYHILRYIRANDNNGLPEDQVAGISVSIGKATSVLILEQVAD